MENRLKALKEDYYPKEMPYWWRMRYSHKNMWKYGIWPQHSVIAHKDHLTKNQKKKILFTRDDYFKESQPHD